MKSHTEMAIQKLREHLSRAISRAVCPECGKPMARQGAALGCSTPECEGVKAVQFRINALRYFDR
jgi:ssDNA-binding Zn-finger/Zn-ribbon topoisomerase 1